MINGMILQIVLAQPLEIPAEFRFGSAIADCFLNVFEGSRSSDCLIFVFRQGPLDVRLNYKVV